MRNLLLALAVAVPSIALAGDAQVDALQREVAQLRNEVARLQAAVAQLKEEQRQLRAKVGNGPQPVVRPGAPDPAVVYAVPVDGAPVRGERDAWVTIVELSDFQCPFCGRASNTMRDVLQKYGPDVRLVYLHNPLPFHRRARPAAIAAACAQQQGQFWPLHDALFTNQRALEDADLETYAHHLQALDFRRWKRCLDDPGVGEKVDAQAKIAERFGARGTPSFFINGHILTGAQPQQRFEELIDAELAKAKASGIPQSYYYQKAVLEEGKASVR